MPRRRGSSRASGRQALAERAGTIGDDQEPVRPRVEEESALVLDEGLARRRRAAG